MEEILCAGCGEPTDEESLCEECMELLKNPLLKYHEKHRFCPRCGEVPAQPYISYLQPPDENRVKCSCGFTGIVDDLIADKPTLPFLHQRDALAWWSAVKKKNGFLILARKDRKIMDAVILEKIFSTNFEGKTK